MAVFGYLVLCLIVVFLTLGWFFIILLSNSFGKSSLKENLILVCGSLPVICLIWGIVITHCPFTVIVN